MTIHIACIVGTRPEAIKMAPLILELKRCGWADAHIVATAQHRQMLDQVLKVFGLTPDTDLNVMTADQTLSSLTSRLLTSLDEVVRRTHYDMIIAQGDTTTVLAAALTSLYHNIPFAHVEAGLRSHDMNSPFPEEANRVIASRLATWHFAPTEGARSNLLREHVPDDRIVVTGNTVIDALLETSRKHPPLDIALDPEMKTILLTTHRRENFGEPIENILRGVRSVIDRNREVQLIFPVHPNPAVRTAAQKHLANHPRIHLTEPLSYTRFVAAMQAAHIVLTDSGGVQEEAPALGKPVLVLRTETERPEAIKAGVAKLVPPVCDDIVREAEILLTDRNAYQRMAKGISPYGDGRAAERIVHHLAKCLVSRALAESPPDEVAGA